MTEHPTSVVAVRRVPNFRRQPGRREEILDAALEVFFLNGYDRGRLEDVARLAGVGKTAVLYHFRNKLALVASMVSKHCLPLLPVSGQSAVYSVSAGLADPAASKVLRFVLGEQRRLPSLGRFYVTALFKRVTSWQALGSADEVKQVVSEAFGRAAAKVLLEGYPSTGRPDDGNRQDSV